MPLPSQALGASQLALQDVTLRTPRSSPSGRGEGGNKHGRQNSREEVSVTQAWMLCSGLLTWNVLCNEVSVFGKIIQTDLLSFQQTVALEESLTFLRLSRIYNANNIT